MWISRNVFFAMKQTKQLNLDEHFDTEKGAKHAKPWVIKIKKAVRIHSRICLHKLREKYDAAIKASVI